MSETSLLLIMNFIWALGLCILWSVDRRRAEKEVHRLLRRIDDLEWDKENILATLAKNQKHLLNKQASLVQEDDPDDYSDLKW